MVLAFGLFKASSIDVLLSCLLGGAVSIVPTYLWARLHRPGIPIVAALGCMSIRSSDILGIPLNWLFSVYMLFLAGTIVHYALRAWRLARGDSLSTLEREESL